MQGLHPTKLMKKGGFFDENSWTTSIKIDEKCAIFDENA